MALNGMQVIALEEHYYDPDVAASYQEGRPGLLRQRLDDLGELRIREMDAAGIDLQVISHGAPGLQRVNAETAVELAVRANDRLAQAIAGRPDRFAGFALLPVPDPQAAADELERAVTRLGFKGAMVHGLIDGQFLDDKRFWPIYERAAALDLPVYVHPAAPHSAVVDAYYKDYASDFPGILGPGWGFTVETATQGIRLVLSGVFDAYPNLQIILGHMGESLPFSLVRIDEALSRPGNKANTFRKTFAEHFYITTSGNFSTPALICSMLEMGIDRILYSVDWPFVENGPGTEWLKTVPLGDRDRAKLFGGNARKLLKL
ncbi:MAG TPA: amidohydrolase family protein [Dehalococcoidia bacterium]|nr:amidohydrolase family protein [Dehalococcoidia bacterium]